MCGMVFKLGSDVKKRQLWSNNHLESLRIPWYGEIIDQFKNKKKSNYLYKISKNKKLKNFDHSCGPPSPLPTGLLCTPNKTTTIFFDVRWIYNFMFVFNFTLCCFSRILCFHCGDWLDYKPGLLNSCGSFQMRSHLYNRPLPPLSVFIFFTYNSLSGLFDLYIHM